MLFSWGKHRSFWGLFSLLFSCCLFGHAPDSTDKTFTKLLDTVVKKVKLVSTPTAAYLKRPELKMRLNQFNTYVTKLGKSFFEGFLTAVLQREKNNLVGNVVLYHGQRREFMLPQDIYAGLSKIYRDKFLHHFIVLRRKDSSVAQFMHMNDFIATFIKSGEIFHHTFDTLPHVRKHLLPVNPSLFGNAYDLFRGECSFGYFLNSDNVSSIIMTDFVEEMFQYFNGAHLFEQYRDRVNELNGLLSGSEYKKTGLLLQIFLPTALVDTVLYRSHAFGFLYYDATTYPGHSALADLKCYEKGDKSMSDSDFDNFQLRMLTNPMLVGPAKGVKIFRYCYKTEVVKKYQALLFDLLQDIAQGQGIKFPGTKDVWGDHEMGMVPCLV